MKKILVAVLASMLLLTAFGCKSNSSNPSLPTAGKYPMTLTDVTGAKITLEKEPQKIVSLAPNCTEILYAVGAGDKLVAGSNWDNYPEEALALEKVGDTFSVNIERILQLDPDIVFVDGSFATDATNALAAAGIPVYAIKAGQVDDIYYIISAFGTITNHAKEAKELNASLKADLKTLQTALKNTPKRTIFIDLGGLYSSSKMDFLGNILSVINADNIALNFEYSSPQLSAETVIQKNPDVYICMSSPEFFVKPAGFNQINAFKNNEVYFIDYIDPRADLITRPGPRFVEGLKVLAKMVHPEINLDK